MAFIRSSNCPRYLVPATMDARSRLITRLSNSTLETFRCEIRNASPSTIADLPTPGSPIKNRIILFSPAQYLSNTLNFLFSSNNGIRLPSIAALVISIPKLSKTGVSVLGAEDPFDPEVLPLLRYFFPNISSPSSLSSGKSDLLSIRVISSIFDFTSSYPLL